MKNSIRGRIIIIFISSGLFVSILTGSYTYDLLTLKKKLVVMEDFHVLLDNILELRRYEKNYVYFNELESLKKIDSYLAKIQKEVTRVRKEIEKVISQQKLKEFEVNLLKYKTAIETKLEKGKEINLSEIRSRGSAMVDFAQGLLELKRKQIQKILFRMLIFPGVAMFGMALFLVFLFRFYVKNILDRLAFIQKATEEIAKGNFIPISDPSKRKDEVSDLIYAFNKMVEELDSRHEQLVQSRKLAAIGTFTSGIAHELNNPLNNISLTADSLLEEFDDLPPAEAKEMILDIINQTGRASEVVKNLLDFSRAESPPFNNLKIKDVIEKTYKLIENQLMLVGVKLTCNVPDDLPTIKGNLHNLEQVFLNLFLNSIQAMPDGGRIIIDAKEEPKGYIRVDVTDTGIGIKPEALEKIFDPFYTTKPVGRGTGLGLSIVYGIIKKHGGYVEVKSEVNKGTTFSIYLPIASDESDEKTTGNESSNN